MKKNIKSGPTWRNMYQRSLWETLSDEMEVELCAHKSKTSDLMNKLKNTSHTDDGGSIMWVVFTWNISFMKDGWNDKSYYQFVLN